ncbi:MAG: glycosyl hydrolase [Gemmatimonadota bacterium]
MLLLAITLLGAPQNPRLEVETSGTTARLQAVSVVSEKIVWASGAKGTYVRTIDGGATWKAGVVPGTDSLEFRDVQGFDAMNAVLLAAGTGDKSRLYRTSDGGRTWTKLWVNTNPKGFYDCVDFAGAEGYVVGDQLEDRIPMLRSIDRGKTWRPYQPQGLQAIQAVKDEGGFAASGTCIVVRPGRTWIVTATGGRVITRIAEQWSVHEPPIPRGPSAGAFSIAMRTDQIGILAAGDLTKPDAFLDAIAVTTDGGATWASGGRPTFGGAPFGIAYVPGRPAPTVVAVGPKGASWSPDEGQSWQSLDVNGYWGLGFAANGTGWLVGPDGRITKVIF